MSETPDYAKDGTEPEKMEKTRKILKISILVSLITFVVILAAVIALAAGTSSKEDKSIVDPPTNKPTEEPTLQPTISSPTNPQPTATPSAKPPTITADPTNYPTPLASELPTISMSPTFHVHDPNYAFKVRLFWQSGYFWQFQWHQEFYCMECVKCDDYGSRDGWEYGCERYPSGFRDSSSCQNGDMIWIMDCPDGGVKFNFITVERTGILVRLDQTGLCLERGVYALENGNYEFKDRLIVVRPCDLSNSQQWWQDFSDLSKFELRPYDHVDLSDTEGAMCVSQLHHPKEGEIVSMHECRLCRLYETRYWEEWGDEEE